MMTTYILLLLLPAIAYSRITIKIKPGKDADDATVDFKGSETSVISDKERETFGLDDETLKLISQIFIGKRCDDVFVKPPTPWGDVYAKYHWDTVNRTLRPVEARVIGIKSKPVAVASAEYVNNHKKIEVTYSTSVTQQVEETVGHTWSTGGELTIGQEINYNVNFGAGSVGGSTSLVYSSSWGEDTTESRTVTLGTTSSVLTTIPPEHKVRALLTATKGTMDIEIDYEATLTSGEIFCNYDQKYENHHFHTIPIAAALFFTEKPTTVRSTEKLSIGFYTSVRIEVNDDTTHEEIQKKPAGIIKAGPQKVV